MDGKLVMLVSADPGSDASQNLLNRLEGWSDWQLETVAEQAALARLRSLTEAQAEPAVVVIENSVAAPVPLARRLRAAWSAGHLLFAPAHSRLEELRRHLSYAPMIGPYWSLTELEDPTLPRHIENARRSSNKRQQLRTTLDRSNLRLARPKPVDSVDYRRLVVSEHYLISLLEQSQDAVFSLDTRDHIVYWSRGAERLFQRSASAMRGVTVRELPCWNPVLEEGLRRVHRGSRREHTELRFERDANETVYLDVLIAGVHDESGAFIGASLALRDITARKRLFEAERRARQEAEDMNRMKDEFMAILSHELRTPLSAVIGRTQVMQMQHADEPDLLASLAVIEKNAQLQAKLIEDLLDTSSILAGKLQLAREAIKPAQLVASATESLRQRADDKGVRLVVEQHDVEGVLIGDPDRLHQLLNNLLTNAIKFTPPGGEVQLRLAQDGSTLRLSASDTGIGISEDFLPRVFERFSQEDSSLNRHHGGLGLGLSISRHLAELHDGRLTATSAGRGKGATFELALPLQVPQHRPAATSARKDGAGNTTHSALQGQRVLLVEDVADSRELVREVLSERGAEVLALGTAKEALARIEDFSPALLISDIGMPDMDGYAFLRELRSRGFTAEKLPAVALTAFTGPAHRSAAQLAGYQRHIAKPLNISDLLATLNELMEQAADALPNRPPS